MAVRLYALLLPKARLNPLAMFAIHVFHGRFVRLIETLPDPSVRSLSPPMATAFELMRNMTLGGARYCLHSVSDNKEAYLGEFAMTMLTGGSSSVASAFLRYGDSPKPPVKMMNCGKDVQSVCKGGKVETPHTSTAWLSSRR